MIYKNKHKIVHLTEVLVSYIPKFSVHHTSLFTAGIVAKTISTSARYSAQLKKKEPDMSLRYVIKVCKQVIS